jgi:zinc transport system substrate-binding protein
MQILVFWVGEDLENFLEKPLASIAKKAEKIELINHMIYKS